jgi:lactoylglutathione lyase
MVNNLEASIKFYREVLGLLENRRFPAGPGMEIAFLGEGETQVELICDEKIPKVTIGTDISMGFEVGPLEPMMELLREKGINILSGPHQPNPHIRYIYVLDPNGLKIQLVENI